MSDAIKGTYEGVSIKKGTKKNGDPWTLYTIIVDGKKYGYGFTMPKAAVGDVVTFLAEQNEKGYWDVDAKSFKTTGETAPVASPPTTPYPQTKNSEAPTNDPRQNSIESQVLIKCAVELAIADENPASVAKYFTTLQGILHPRATVDPNKAGVAKPKPAPVEETEEELPY